MNNLKMIRIKAVLTCLMALVGMESAYAGKAIVNAIPTRHLSGGRAIVNAIPARKIVQKGQVQSTTSSVINLNVK